MQTDEVIFHLIAVERRRAADLLESLDDAQLQTQSLCAQWTVRDIAGHLISPFSVSLPEFLVGVIRNGGFSRYSVKLSQQLGRRPLSEIVQTLRHNADNEFTPPLQGPGAPLTDLAVHVRDVARPLGLATSASPDAWESVLAFLTAPQARRGFIPRGRLSGLRFEATDLDWAYGDGPPLRGNAEALAMAIAGRRVALNDLTGEGVTRLSARLR
jgi:uncharacterized protein (TIGR03083 family)